MKLHLQSTLHSFVSDQIWNHEKYVTTDKYSQQALWPSNGREDKKGVKYSNLSENYHFVPVIIETYGAYVPQAIKLVKQIGKKNTGSYR